MARLQKEISSPTGWVALVFTDIKNSTFLWETVPDAMRSALKQHNAIMRRQLHNIGGYEVKWKEIFLWSLSRLFHQLYYGVLLYNLNF
jgi:hypothetical protein